MFNLLLMLTISAANFEFGPQLTETLGGAKLFFEQGSWGGQTSINLLPLPWDHSKILVKNRVEGVKMVNSDISYVFLGFCLSEIKGENPKNGFEITFGGGTDIFPHVKLEVGITRLLSGEMLGARIENPYTEFPDKEKKSNWGFIGGFFFYFKN